MPISSASSEIFWQCLNFFDLVQYFEHIQIFLTKVKSDILRYKFAYLSMVKIFDHNIEQSQKF